MVRHVTWNFRLTAAMGNVLENVPLIISLRAAHLWRRYELLRSVSLSFGGSWKGIADGDSKQEDRNHDSFRHGRVITYPDLAVSCPF